VTHKDRAAAGFWDASLWEESKTKGETALKNLIDEGLKNTSVTVVLIGRKTSERKWVNYEIKQSFKKGNGMLGIFIHGIKDRSGYKDYKGKNPFKELYIGKGYQKTYLSDIYETYYWKWDDGYNNIGSWVEYAAQKAGK